MTVLAVNRDCVFRFHKGIDQLQILLAGMSGNMCILEDNLCAFCRQLIDHAGNRLLISRDRVGTEDNRIVRLNRHLSVNIRGHTGQSRHGLSLASRCDKHHLLGRIVLHLVNLNQGVLRHIQIAQLRCNGNDIYHAPAFHDYFSAVFVCGINNLLHTVHIGSECSDDETGILMFRKNMVKCNSYCALRLSKSSSLRIRTV